MCGIGSDLLIFLSNEKSFTRRLTMECECGCPDEIFSSKI